MLVYWCSCLLLMKSVSAHCVQKIHPLANLVTIIGKDKQRIDITKDATTLAVTGATLTLIGTPCWCCY